MLDTELHRVQRERWPAAGRHILAHYDDTSIVVYQAYRASIAEAAVQDRALGGGGFSFGRMSWIKPNFLWMMFRCEWARREEAQARVLAIRIRRSAFDAILAAAVPSTASEDEAEWRRALARSEVRLQWDPDHGPTGGPLTRRAIQLGLRGTTLQRFATSDVVAIEDITPFVEAQRGNRDRPDALRTPIERVYPVEEATATRIRLDRWP